MALHALKAVSAGPNGRSEEADVADVADVAPDVSRLRIDLAQALASKKQELLAAEASLVALQASSARSAMALGEARAQMQHILVETQAQRIAREAFSAFEAKHFARMRTARSPVSLYKAANEFPRYPNRAECTVDVSTGHASANAQDQRDELAGQL